jgi:hypothetical protein
MTIEGAINAEIFQAYGREVLVPSLQSRGSSPGITHPFFPKLGDFLKFWSVETKKLGCKSDFRCRQTTRAVQPLANRKQAVVTGS